MKRINIDSNWKFNHGIYGGMSAILGEDEAKVVNLPHDYMIETDVRPDAPAGPASGYYTAGVAYYTKKIEIPESWEGETVYLHFDGVMMNATVDVNGCKAALQHYGYAPFVVDITPFIYYGRDNRITITVNPSMQPNSRWYSGAGIFRSVEVLHGALLHIVNDGIYAYTNHIEEKSEGGIIAYLKTEIEIENKMNTNRLAMVEVWLTEDGKEDILVHRQSKIQINPNSKEVAYIPVTLENAKLWDTQSPNLYRVHARVKDLGEFRTHHIEISNGSVDESSTIFGIRTITAEATHGLRINGKTVKLKGGCLHHDNGILGAISLYEAEYRKLSILKSQGFNAVRTTHNPPSSVFLEACDRLGIYVFDEAFDTWGIMKQPGDYNMFFETDWQKDLTAFVKRDRTHPSVIIWSTGNEIPERGGLNNGYTVATRLVNHVRNLDSSRPISNGICSFWSGLDDELTEQDIKRMQSLMSNEAAGIQNVDFGSEDLSWENYSEGFTNGLDIVGYNYMEDKYPKDHELYPERVILGSENYPKEIGKRWPMVKSCDYVIGDFTWTAYDYIGEAGIGKTVFVEDSDPRLKAGPFALMSHTSEYPWRLANDADVDINGNILPQGFYRRVVWGDEATYLFAYNPANYGLTEIVSMWGFTDVSTRWNWDGYENKPIRLVVFSCADEVELILNGKSVGRKKAGESLAVEDMPLSFVFDTVYQPGTITAVSYKNNSEISRSNLSTTDGVKKVRITPEKQKVQADIHSLAYINIELVDENEKIVQCDDRNIVIKVEGAGQLQGLGSSNPITNENYTSHSCKTYRGRAMAVIRSTGSSGSIKVCVSLEDNKDVQDFCVVESI